MTTNKKFKAMVYICLVLFILAALIISVCNFFLHWKYFSWLEKQPSHIVYKESIISLDPSLQLNFSIPALKYWEDVIVELTIVDVQEVGPFKELQSFYYPLKQEYIDKINSHFDFKMKISLIKNNKVAKEIFLTNRNFFIYSSYSEKGYKMPAYIFKTKIAKEKANTEYGINIQMLENRMNPVLSNKAVLKISRIFYSPEAMGWDNKTLAFLYNFFPICFSLSLLLIIVSLKYMKIF